MARRVEGRSDRLLECARAEFMEMGYQEASLRVISARADTTTGSIYTRFGDKEGLFHALVDDTVSELLAWFRGGQERFAEKPSDEQYREVFAYCPELWDQLVDFIYAHWDEFRLLVRCNDIGCYEEMLHQIIEIETEYTCRFIEATGNDLISSGKLSLMMIHILSNAFYAGLFEVVRHEMPREEAHQYVRQLRRFFVRGWTDLLGLE